MRFSCPVNRYLTAEEKRTELATWNALIAGGRFTSDERDEGGCGYPDPAMIRWCAHLNDVPGVCTLQSCAGHPGKGGGHLWVRLSGPMRRAFDRQAFRLAARVDLIECVAIEYKPWGKEIASIAFAGNERDSLNRSMRLIVAFFRSLHQRT